MRTQIAARHCDVPKDVLARAEEQIQKLTRYDSRVSSAEVVFTEEKHSKKAEIILHIDGTAPLVAHAEESDFRSALDKTLDRLGRMLKRQRQRHRDHHAPPLSESTVGD